MQDVCRHVIITSTRACHVVKILCYTLSVRPSVCHHYAIKRLFTASKTVSKMLIIKCIGVERVTRWMLWYVENSCGLTL